MSSDTLYINHILQSASVAIGYLEGMALAGFTGNLLYQDAVVRRLLIIGEATRRLSEEFKAAHPDIPWAQMRGMRNYLIHDYDAVDMREVYRTVTEDLPALMSQLEAIVPPDSDD